MPDLLKPGHEVISGMTGTGKSYLVLYKIIKSFEADRPCCYIDPKGESYRALLEFLIANPVGREIWQRFSHRILFVNPVSKSDHIVGFNAIKLLDDFANFEVDPVALTANSLVSHIRRQSGFELYDANRMQNVLAASIGLLTDGSSSRLTLAEIPLLFRRTYRRGKGGKSIAETYNPFVQELLKRARHHGTRSFWEDQWAIWTPHARAEWVQSSMGRVFQYLFDDRLRYTTCTVDNATLDFDRVINGRYWLFVNAPYQFLDEAVTTLLGNIIITSLHYAAMRRGPDGPPYRILLDEARFFNTGPLQRILETARAYSLWLTLVVQNLNQMCRTMSGGIDYGLRDTVLNECRYFAIFQNKVDAPLFADFMYPATGMVPRGTRQSGDIDYLPVNAEENQNAAIFAELPERQCIYYDKQEHQPRHLTTRTVKVPELEQEQINRFEAQHLQLTGRPSYQIREEIEERQFKIRQLIAREEEGGEPDRSLPTPKYGVW